jgi:murein DD-endopeptidase MepM/ murein hydrolase activator NlpD
MANYDKEIFDLEQVLGYLGRKIDYERETRAPEVLSLGLSYYQEYFRLNKKIKRTPAFAQDPGVNNYQNFQRLVAPIQVGDIIAFFRTLGAESDEEESKPKKATQKEDSTVPAELETLVALYKESQTDQLDANATHTVSDAVKRARKTWATKHQADLIRENRLALIQDKSARDQQKEMEDLDRDLFLVQTVNPKAESAQVITRNLEKVSRQAVIAQAANLGLGLTTAQINQAVGDLTYLGLSGAIDPTNFQDLNIVSQLAFRNLEGITINSPINKLDDEVKAWQEASEKDPYSDKPDEIEKQINVSDDESQKYFSTATKSFQFRLKQNNLDFADDLESAQKELLQTQSALLKAIPNAALPSAGPTPLHQNFKAFEAALRQADPQLKINPTQAGSQAIGLLEITHGENRNISPEAIRLYSLGLTTTRLTEIEKSALANPNSSLGQFYQTHRDVFQQVRFQIKKLSDPHSKIGQEISKSLKPLNSISSGLASFYNTHPGLQTVAKIALDPVGSAKSWASRQAGRQIGKHLIENTGSLATKKIGGFLMEHGLKDGVTALTKAAAQKALVKVATWAALKLGISLTAESLNAIMPGLGLLVDVVVQIALWLAEKTIGAAYNAFQGVAESIYGEKIKARDFLIPLVTLGGAAAAVGSSFFAGLVLVVRTTQIAIISAVGIIIAAVVTIGLYLGFTYLVAPMLSTLVQLDSVEKVDYSQYGPVATSSGDCAWPTKGRYMVQSGPDGGTHDLSNLQAIDIFGPGNINGTPIVSSTDGIVTTKGPYSNYGNTIVIQTKNSAGSFQVIYGHMSSMSVGVGQKVTQGQKIGTVGSTSLFPNPHIHFEYKGIKYNQCPAGGKKIPDKCANFVSCGSVYTN